MKTTIATAVILVAIVAGFLLFKGVKKAPLGTTATTTEETASSTAASFKTYTNDAEGIAFDYPNNFVLRAKDEYNSSAWSLSSTSTGQLLAVVSTPQDFGKGTNLNDVNFAVGFTQDKKELANCTKANPYMTASGTTTISNVPFSRFTMRGAAAGNLYDSVSYRGIKDNRCFEISYTIHYGNIANYDPKLGIKEFDENSAVAFLDSIAHSFRFTK